MKKLIICIALILSITIIISSCENSIDLREVIEADVKLHNNPKHFLSVYATTGGTVSPDRDTEIVDEMPVEISAEPSSGYAFKNWRFTEGEGYAVLNESVKTGSNVITVTGGNVSIQAVFVRQPVIISTYPQNSDVARNMPIRIVFSKILDESSITDQTIQVYDLLLDKQISGSLEINGSEVMFFARDSSLEKTPEGLYLWESNRSYQVFIRQNVLDLDGITLLEETSWAFSTGTEVDNTPPVISSFSIESLSGNTSYTNSEDVLLVFEAQDESTIPIRAVKYWNLGEAEPSTVTLLSEVLDVNGKIPYNKLSGEGVKQVNLKVYDMSNNESDASASIVLDKTAPVLSYCGLNDPEANADGFANTRSLSFQLSGTDTYIAESSIGYVFDDSNGTMSWQDYTTDPVSIMLPNSDGEHVAYFRLRDPAGNVGLIGQDSILLDRTAPTGTVSIKGGSEWANAGDQNAAISLTRSDLTVDNGDEIDIAFRVEGDGWSLPAAAGAYSSERVFASSVSDVDLFSNGYETSPDEEITVYVKLIDKFDYTRIISDTIRLDTAIPTAPGVPDLAAEDDTGPATISDYDSDNLTSKTDNLTFSGSCMAADTPLLQVLDNGTVRGNFVPTSDTYSFDGSGFGTGSRTIKIRAIDPAGNYDDSPALTLNIDNTAPDAVITLYSLDNSTTSFIKKDGVPSVQLQIAKTDSGVAGLEGYQWDTSKSGVNWSGWITDTQTNVNINTTFSETWGDKYGYLQVRDRAGNVASASDAIRNYYHAYFSLYSVYVSDNAESGAGEMYWDFSLGYRETSGGALINYNYIFQRPPANAVSMDDGDTIYLSNISLVGGEYRTLHWYRSSPPYSFRVSGYLVEEDTASADDWSNPASYEVATGSSFRKTHTITVTGSPAGNIRFTGDDNKD